MRRSPSALIRYNREHVMPSYGPHRPGTVPTWVEPPAEARRIAKRALKDREKLPKSKRGGLDAAEAKKQGVTSGVVRAKSIARGDWQPAEDVNAFFQRFKGTHAASQDKRWEDSKVQQAWDLWGGDAMWRAAQGALRKGNPASDIRWNKFRVGKSVRYWGHVETPDGYVDTPTGKVHVFYLLGHGRGRNRRYDLWVHTGDAPLLKGGGIKLAENLTVQEGKDAAQAWLKGGMLCSRRPNPGSTADLIRKLKF